jgi:hypothetical protein
MDSIATLSPKRTDLPTYHSNIADNSIYISQFISNYTDIVTNVPKCNGWIRVLCSSTTLY